jgi:hypothetical protein
MAKVAAVLKAVQAGKMAASTHDNRNVSGIHRHLQNRMRAQPRNFSLGGGVKMSN